MALVAGRIVRLTRRIVARDGAADRVAAGAGRHPDAVAAIGHRRIAVGAGADPVRHDRVVMGAVQRDAVAAIGRDHVGNDAGRGLAIFGEGRCVGVVADLVARRSGGDMDTIACVAGGRAVEGKSDVVVVERNAARVERDAVAGSVPDREAHELRAGGACRKDQAGIAVEVDSHRGGIAGRWITGNDVDRPGDVGEAARECDRARDRELDGAGRARSLGVGCLDGRPQRSGAAVIEVHNGKGRHPTTLLLIALIALATLSRRSHKLRCRIDEFGESSDE